MHIKLGIYNILAQQVILRNENGFSEIKRLTKKTKLFRNQLLWVAVLT